MSEKNFYVEQIEFIKNQVTELLNGSGYTDSQSKNMTDLFLTKIVEYPQYEEESERKAQLGGYKYGKYTSRFYRSRYPEFDYAAEFIQIDIIWLHGQLDYFTSIFLEQNK